MGTERHKSRNRCPPLSLHRSHCSNNLKSTVALRESNLRYYSPLSNHQTHLNTASLPKNNFYNGLTLYKLSNTSTFLIHSKRHKSRNRRPSILPHRRDCSNNRSSPVAHRESKSSRPPATFKSSHHYQGSFAP